MRKLQFVGIDDWSVPVYKDETGALWKDVNLGRGAPSLYSALNNDFNGEPDMPIRGEYEIVDKLKGSE